MRMLLAHTHGHAYRERMIASRLADLHDPMVTI